MNEKAEQVNAQLELAKRMANIISRLCDVNRLRAYRAGEKEDEIMLDILGRSSHYWIELLGDILNSVDAATKEDEDLATPVFAGARKHFPIGDTATFWK